MTLIQALRVQHLLLFDLLAYLEEQKSTLRGGDVHGLKEVVFAIAKAVDRHAEVEEKILFPALQPELSKKIGPATVMEFEHQRIREILDALKSTDDTHAIQVEISKFVVFLKDHMAQEECILFPYAEGRLDERRLTELFQQSGLLKVEEKLFQ